MQNWKVLLLATILGVLLCACGKEQYTCSKCNQTTDVLYRAERNAGKDILWCETCTRDYWHPFPYEHLKVTD